MGREAGCGGPQSLPWREIPVPVMNQTRWLLVLREQTGIDLTADREESWIARNNDYAACKMGAECEERGFEGGISKSVKRESQQSLSGASLAASYTGKT